jgi:hypothetical protein
MKNFIHFKIFKTNLFFTVKAIYWDYAVVHIFNLLVHIKLFKSVILLPQTLNKCQEFSIDYGQNEQVAVTDEMQIIASGLTTFQCNCNHFERIF